MVYGRTRTPAPPGRVPPASGSGRPSRPTRRSSTGPPGTPPRRPPARALHQPRRRQAQHPAAARLPATAPGSGARPASAAWPACASGQPRRVHLLPLPAQPGQPPPRRRPPDHPAPCRPPRPGSTGHPAVLRRPCLRPRRARLLAAQLPATDAAARADRDACAAALKARLRQIDTGQNSCILELEQLPADPADTAAAALRTRIRARFADLHAEREQLHPAGRPGRGHPPGRRHRPARRAAPGRGHPARPARPRT